MIFYTDLILLGVTKYGKESTIIFTSLQPELFLLALASSRENYIRILILLLTFNITGFIQFIFYCELPTEDHRL